MRVFVYQGYCAIGEPLFACGPRHGLDADATAWAGHPARGVKKERRNTPQGDKLEPTQQGVVAWPGASAPRALRALIRPGPDRNIEVVDDSREHFTGLFSVSMQVAVDGRGT